MKGGIVADRCDFCADLGFKEQILCDLNRSIQNTGKFTCHAFRTRPRARLFAVKDIETPSDSRESPRTQLGDHKLLGSDRFKHGQALATQRALSDPDAVHLDLKYHLAWNVARRKPVFNQPADIRPILDKAFYTCDEKIGGFASVLWLAPDHIHVYVESDGERPIEAIVKELKRVSTFALTTESHLNRLVPGKIRRIWDRAYFAETLG